MPRHHKSIERHRRSRSAGADEAVTNAALAASSTVDPAASADPSAIDNMFQQDFYLPLHTALENWLPSPSGQQFDNAINPLLATSNSCGLICNGTPGTVDDPEGGHGGFLFGDGGAGYNSATAGVAGGEGGAAALFGNAGAGGTGGPRRRRCPRCARHRWRTRPVTKTAVAPFLAAGG